MLTHCISEESLLKRRGFSLDWLLLTDTQLSPDADADPGPCSGPCSGPGPAESRRCFSCLQHKTQRFEYESWWWSDLSGRQVEMVVSPLRFGLAVIFPTQSDFRGRNSLLSNLTLIHSRAHTFTPSHTTAWSVLHPRTFECSSSLTCHKQNT